MGNMHYHPNSQKPSVFHKHSGVADALFSSTQQRLFSVLFGQPERSFYANELISLAGIGTGAVQRELKRLTQTGLLTVTTIGNQKHYQVNSDAPIFNELRGIVLKTFGTADKIRDALLSLEPKITCAFIYGSVAKGVDHAGSDIDVMVVSDNLTLGDIFSVLQSVEQQLGRKVGITLYTCNEFTQRRKTGNPFLTKVLAGTIIPLIGEMDGNS